MHRASRSSSTRHLATAVSLAVQMAAFRAAAAPAPLPAVRPLRPVAPTRPAAPAYPDAA